MRSIHESSATQNAANATASTAGEISSAVDFICILGCDFVKFPTSKKGEPKMPDLSPDKILQTGFAFWASKTMLTAVDIGIFTELAREKQDLASLQSRFGFHRRSAADFLDALVALGFLERENGVYRNSAETDLFLDKNKPSYMGGMMEMCNQRLYRFWDN